MKHIITKFFLIIISVSLYSQVPQTISWQGILQDSEQKNLSGTYSLTAKLFLASSGSTAIWSETHNNVTVADGLVNLSLGSLTPFNINFDDDYWLEITVGNGTPLPRISLSAVPYAIRAKTVETGDNWGSQTVVSDATLSGSGTTVSNLKLAQQGANIGQILKWNGSTWSPANDSLGGLILPYEATASTSAFSSALKVTNAGQSTYAITGHATNTNPFGSSRGIYGISDADNGIGIQGYVTHKTGYSQGVSGLSESSGGVGVFGRASSTTGETVGVIGRSESTAGTGVFGVASTFTGTNYGVQGRSSSTSGTGVQGEATATSGSTFGVTGRSSSPSGAGVFGTSSATTGSAWGVFGSSGSTSGRGIGARAYSPTGTTYGIHAEVLSNNGFSGYFTGGKFYVSGNVGIGTEAPQYRLDLYASGTGSTGLAIFRNSTGDEKVQIRQNSNGSGAVYVYKAGGGDQTVSFVGEGNSYINGGNLGIGTVSPSQKLDVIGNIRVSAIGSGVYWGPVNRSFDGTFTTSTSDIRMKENVQTINDGLSKVMQLRGVTFTWKSNPEYGNRIGFIAQELEKVLPELVFTNEVDGYKGVNYAEVTAVLVEAIKEQNKLLDNQNEKINELERKLELLIQQYSNNK